MAHSSSFAGADAWWIVAARFADRVGKGIRGAPRDALIADLTPADVRGGSFGLRQALDTVGAIGGPLLAIGAMAYFASDFKSAFWVAVVPAILCVLLLVFGVEEPAKATGNAASDSKSLHLGDARRLGRRYAIVVAIAAILTLARFSEAFLILRAQNVGVPAAMAPWVMVVMSTVYAAVAYPAGAAADRGLGPRMLSAGFGALIAADLVLATASGATKVFAGAALWGLHMGLTQGLLAALVAAAAPADLRGTAFGVFNLVCGIALLIASVLVVDTFGPASFYAPRSPDRVIALARQGGGAAFAGRDAHASTPRRSQWALPDRRHGERRRRCAGCPRYVYYRHTLPVRIITGSAWSR